MYLIFLSSNKTEAIITSKETHGLAKHDYWNGQDIVSQGMPIPKKKKKNSAFNKHLIKNK